MLKRMGSSPGHVQRISKGPHTLHAPRAEPIANKPSPEPVRVVCGHLEPSHEPRNQARGSVRADLSLPDIWPGLRLGSGSVWW